MIKKLIVIFSVVCLSFSAFAAEQKIINKPAYEQMLSFLLIDQEDVELYKKIFRNIEKADFTTADEQISDLQNNILLGTVLAQKYLHPKYVSSIEELQSWLDKYADLPEASRIYRLAQRKDKTQKKEFSYPDIPGNAYLKAKKYDNATKRYLYNQVQNFQKALRKGKTKKARLVLEQSKFRQLIPDAKWDDLAANLAKKYFVDGYDKLAWQWATKAARRRTSGTAYWIAGLSAWRQKQYQNAATYFNRLATSNNQDEWLVSAGGYWAYRAYEQLGQKQKAQSMLQLASKYKHTMYGILAAYKLGETLTYNWDAEAYHNDFTSLNYIYELVASPHIRRAIILLHAKQPVLAEKELRHGYPDMNDKQKEAVVFIANQYGFHSLAIYAGNECKDVSQGRSYDALVYPIPGWWPTHGWRVHEPLVLALVRQESSFRVEAQSSAGACGLMQLMPRTAYHITRDASLKRDKSRLLKPEYNLELGQKYVSYLLGKTFVDGNLFYMMTAYNAGPGNLLKWQKNTKYNNDALLFIEAIPAAETRIYIERVMANYWIYNMRFQMDNPTLEQVASGQWPILEK